MTEGEIRASYRQAKYPKQQIRILSQLTNKSIADIKRICGLKVNKSDEAAIGMRGTWSKEEIEYLKANHHLSTKELASRLGKTIDMIAYKRRSLKLPKKKKGVKWTPEDVAFLINAVNDGTGYKDIAKYLGRSPESVASEMYQLKIKGRL